MINICLIGILKNESNDNIELKLLSYLPIIDQFYFHDIGSTDRTIEIVKEFSEKYNIPGSVISVKWLSFINNYNFLLEKVYNDKLGNKATHLFFNKTINYLTNKFNFVTKRHKNNLHKQLITNKYDTYGIMSNLDNNTSTICQGSAGESCGNGSGAPGGA